MPKITEGPVFRRNYSFPCEFNEIYQKFLQIIKLDPEIVQRASEVQKQSGITSLGIRVAIENYVNKKWILVLEKKAEILKK